MWRQNRGTPITAKVTESAREATSLCEVGCGYGHFIQSLIDDGWRGRFVGYEMSAEGSEQTFRRCEKAEIPTQVMAGDFLTNVQEPADGEELYDLAVCRDVVIHQAHWMPMALAMLRVAEVAMIGIGYVSQSEFHVGDLRKAGHYDIWISPELLEREARAVGLTVETEIFDNRSRKCKEMLVTLRW